MTSRAFLLSGLCGLLLTLVGCGSGGLPIGEVNGSLLGADGKPLGNILVQFYPEGEGATSSSGITDASGKFKLKTSDGREGAVLGSHTVVLIDNNLAEEGEVPPEGVKKVKPSRINRRLNNSKTSDIKVTVEASKKDYEIKVPAR